MLKFYKRTTVEDVKSSVDKNLIFALAMASDVSPRELVQMYGLEVIKSYARDVQRELEER